MPTLTALTARQRLALALGSILTVFGMAGARLAAAPGWVTAFDNLHWTASTLTAAALALIGWHERAPGPERTLTGWLGLGLAGYALGQLVWDIQAWLGYAEFPAPADLAYLTLGPCFIAGCVTLLVRRASVAARDAALLDVTMIAIAFLALVFVLYLPRRGDNGSLALLTLVSYPASWFAAFAALAVISLTLRVPPDAPGAALGVALLGNGLIWMEWNFLALDGITVPGSWLNVSFSVFNLLIGYGAGCCAFAPRTSAEWDRLCETVLRLLPVVVLLVACAALIAAHHLLSLPAAVTRFADAGAIVVALLALTRQGLLLRERDELIATRQALTAERARLTTVLHTIPDLVWLKDTEGVYLGCNRRFEELFGADEAQIVGRTDYDFVPRDLADGFRENDRLALAAGGPRKNEEELRFASGGYRGVFETIKTPILGAHGEVIGVLGIGRDITDRKHIQDQLAIQAGILASLPEGILLARVADQRIVYASPQMERLFGYGAGELLGAHVAMLNAPGAENPAAVAQAIEQALAAHGSWEGDVRNVRKDGALFWSHVVISGFVHPEHGRVWVSVHEDASARVRAEEEVKSLAFYDPLTHLPNRRLMLDRAHQASAAAARSGGSGALMLIDLDNFKVLNDTLGHDVGDQLLVGVSERLVGCLREGDTVARLGGDEFVIILGNLAPGAEGAVQAEAVAHKIRSALDVPHNLSTTGENGTPVLRQHQCTPSIGICLIDGTRLGVDELLKRADTSMYQAKRAGRNTICFFDPTMQQAIETRAALEEEIRTAVYSGQFILHFQPQIDGAGRLTGAEVLVRWQHPERGMISPAVFIPLAEETGLILPIGHHVLHQACEQLSSWRAQPEFADLVLSVNVSARQMSVPGFEEEVVALLTATGVAPERLKLELTEGLLLHNTEDVIAKMQALRRHGVSFSLDDFGTGYSSLSYLKRLPLAQLKIDQSFVRDLLTDANDEAIARTVIALGHSLGLHVIAEGVELPAQQEALRRFGCDAYQGYLYGKPMPIADFEALVRGWSAS